MFRSISGASAVALAFFMFQPLIAAAATVPEIGNISTSDQGTEPTFYDQRPRSTVTREQIEARGAHTVADALRQVPGVAVFSYGALGATSSISIDGTSSSSDVLILLNGFPLNLGSTGAVDLATIPTVGLERIDVYTGGASTLYGANAVAGVINLVTGAPDKLDAAIAHGSFNDTDLRAAVARPAGHGTIGVAAENHTAANTYSYPAAATYGSASGFAAGSRTNADAALMLGRLTYDGDPNARFQIHAVADSSSLKLGVPGSVTFPSTTARENTNRQLLGLSASEKHGRSTTTVALSETTQNLRYRDLEQNVDPQAPANLLGEDVTADRRTDFSIRNATSSAHGEILTGADFTREIALIGLGESALPGPPTQTGAAQTQSAVYTQLLHTYSGGSKWYAGLRGENDRPQGGALAPAAGGTLALGALRLQGDAGVSYRVPTLVDLYYPGFSNPALQPQRSRTYNVSLGDPQVLGGMSIGAFARSTRNYISLDQNFVPQNIATASVAGLNVVAATKPAHGVVFRGSFTDTFRALDLTNPRQPQRLPYVPSTTATFSIEHPVEGNRPGFGIDGNVYGPAQQYSGIAQGFATIDGYVQIPAKATILSVRARNIGNEGYELVSGYPMPGRSIEVELATR